MNRFSIIILRFFYAKISRNYEIFQKILKKISAADAENQKISIRRRRQREKKLKFPSRRRRERRRLTPLIEKDGTRDELGCEMRCEAGSNIDERANISAIEYETFSQKTCFQAVGFDHLFLSI
jgi:hypothetical protein